MTKKRTRKTTKKQPQNTQKADDNKPRSKDEILSEALNDLVTECFRLKNRETSNIRGLMQITSELKELGFELPFKAENFHFPPNNLTQ